MRGDTSWPVGLAVVDATRNNPRVVVNCGLGVPLAVALTTATGFGLMPALRFPSDFLLLYATVMIICFNFPMTFPTWERTFIGEKRTAKSQISLGKHTFPFARKAIPALKANKSINLLAGVGLVVGCGRDKISLLPSQVLSTAGGSGIGSPRRCCCNCWWLVRIPWDIGIPAESSLETAHNKSNSCTTNITHLQEAPGNLVRVLGVKMHDNVVVIWTTGLWRFSYPAVLDMMTHCKSERFG